MEKYLIKEFSLGLTDSLRVCLRVHEVEIVACESSQDLF